MRQFQSGIRNEVLAVALISMVNCSGLALAEESNGKARPNVIMINIDNHDVSTLGFVGKKMVVVSYDDKTKSQYLKIAKIFD